MTDLYYTVGPEVFAQFPGYVRGVVLAYGVTNDLSSTKLVALLREAEVSVRNRLTLDKVAEHPRIKSWRDAYRAFGAKPSEFRSSIESLARRVLHDQEIPAINALVDIGNIVSLRHLVPAGGHAIDIVTHDLALRPATGTEEFVAFGSDNLEHPLPGEIIFTEGNTVLTRRWTWRQAKHSLILPETHAIEFNVDGLPPVSVLEIEQICQEVIELFERFCGGHTRLEILTEQHPKIRLTE